MALPTTVRFWQKTEKDASGCILWIGGKRDRRGYGSFSIGGVNYRAHRVSYTWAHGEIPKGKVILHLCDIPSCVNPLHLKMGTQKENVQDMIRKGRHKK